MTAKPLPYPPPWQDTATLAQHLSISAEEIDALVAEKVLPRPRIRGGIAFWSWAEVENSRRGRVYFIRCGDFIKIGFTEDTKARLAALQTSTPYDLKLLAVIVGGRKKEGELHERFKAHHHRLEWFHAAPEILAYIESVS